MTQSETAPPDDSTFFHKGQISVGKTLLYLGRLDPGTRWVVTKIKSFSLRSDAGWVWVSTCRMLSDDVYLKNVDTGEQRTATFGYLSYSAIWRLA